MKSTAKKATGLLTCILAIAWILGALDTRAIRTVVAHEEAPDPPFVATAVQITDDLPCFAVSLDNPYSDLAYNPKVCGGLLSPLIATHTTNVHSGLIWTKGAKAPKLLSWFRHPEFRANDVVDSDILESLISGSGPFPLGLTSPPLNPLTGQNEGALRDPRSNFQAAVRQSYAWGIYGGFNIVGHGRSVARRIHADRGIENVQLWDLSHPLAFANNGKYDVAKLTDADAALNMPAFKDAGFSRGLRYNIYCPGHVTIADGRVVVVGGNDMNSNNGQYKVNIFDPETETWAPRAAPCTRAAWADASLDDPWFDAFFAPRYASFFADPTNPAKRAALYFLNECNPVTGGAKATVTTEMGLPFIRYEGPTATNPQDRSDMRYARWYPTALALPNNTVLAISGVDQNESLGTTQPLETDPATGKPVLNLDPVSGYPISALSDSAFRTSKIFQVVSEVYDPATDRTTAMENARLIMPVYVHAFPVQTGPGNDDWKVAVFPGSLLSSVGGNQKFEGFHGGKTWLFDVQAALRDPSRQVPGENHLTFVDGGADDHASYFGTAELLDLGLNGRLRSHKVAAFGGQRPDPVTGRTVITATVEMIDFADPHPTWRQMQPLYQPARGTKVTPLADGTVIIAGGNASGNPNTTGLEKENSLNFQRFNPEDGTTTKLRVKTTVPRSIHGDIFLLPDATVMLTGDDHTNSVQRGDRVAPFGDADLGVDTAEIYSPPYLFNDDGSLATRPVITKAPDKIRYGRTFEIEVAEGTPIKSVAIVRTGLPTHSQYANIRYIKLAFIPNDPQEGPSGTDRLTVHAPAVPAQAVPGDYMLFVIDENGIPSVAKHVRVPVFE
jgi:hypothetical protein